MILWLQAFSFYDGRGIWSTLTNYFYFPSLELYFFSICNLRVFEDFGRQEFKKYFNLKKQQWQPKNVRAIWHDTPQVTDYFLNGA